MVSGKVYRKIGKSTTFLWKAGSTVHLCRVNENDVLVALAAPTSTGTLVLDESGKIGEIGAITRDEEFAEIALCNSSLDSTL